MKIKDTAVLLGWSKQIYIESFHFRSQGRKHGSREGFILTAADFHLLYCSSQGGGGNTSNQKRGKMQVLDSKQDADWIRQNLWQPV